MDPLTASVVVFIAKAIGGIGGYTLMGQGSRAAVKAVRISLEDSEQPIDIQVQALLDSIESGALDQAITVWHHIISTGGYAKKLPVLHELLINAMRERQDLLRDIAKRSDRILAQMIQPMIIKLDDKITTLLGERWQSFE